MHPFDVIDHSSEHILPCRGGYAQGGGGNDLQEGRVFLVSQSSAALYDARSEHNHGSRYRDPSVARAVVPVCGISIVRMADGTGL